MEALRPGDTTLPIEPLDRSAGTTISIRVVGPVPKGSGLRVDEFKIVRAIGAGGMGRVYKAVQGSTGRYVALKTIRPEYAADPVFRERFIREATAAGELRHPGIVWLHAAGEAEGTLWIAYEWVRGKDLGAILEVEGRLQPRRALQIAAEIAESLHAAHLRGIIHRDLKPENVIIDESGAARLADFGLAKKLPAYIEGGGEFPTLSMSGEAMGTPHYMAPEQARGKIDLHGPWTDLWALGVLLYRSLTGVVPFDAPGVYPLLAAIVRKDYKPAGEVVPELPPVLDALLAQLLEKDSARRASQADVLARVLRRVAIDLRERGADDAESIDEPTDLERSRSSPPIGFVVGNGWMPVGQPAREPRKGERVGRFRIVEKLGHGVRGASFLAEEPTFRFPVAIRFPGLDPVAPLAAFERLKARLDAVLPLRHPGILPIDEVGIWNDAPYLVTRWIEAPMLRGLLVAGPLPRKRALPLLGLLALTLEHARACGASHGGLRPSVIHVEQERPLLRDLGLADLLPGPTGRAALEKDLTDFGSLLRECLATRHEDRPTPGLDPDILEFVRGCQSSPSTFANFQEVAHELARLGASSPPARAPWSRRARALLASVPPAWPVLAATILVLVAVLSWVFFPGGSRDASGPEPARPGSMQGQASAPPPQLSVAWRAKPRQGPIFPPGIADLDGDGEVEVLVGDEEGYLTVLRGRDGTILRFLAPGNPAAARAWAYVDTPSARGNVTWKIVRGDLDGDGVDDTVVLEPALVVLFDGRTGRRSGVVLGASPTSGPSIFDLDGDGASEVLIPLADGSLLALRVRP